MSSTILSRRLIGQATRTSTFRLSCRVEPVHTPLQQRRYSSYDHLREELPQRRIPLIYDDLAPLSAHRLNVSLRSFLPVGWVDLSKTLPEKSPERDLPPAYHLVYFNPTISSEELLPDGTDPLQSPGQPFVRRMWAGGYLRLNPNPGVNGIKLDGKRYVCMEGIRDVQIKGKEGEEKVFVGIERRMAPVKQSDTEDSIRARLWTENEEDFGEAVLIERRNIVFMRERTPKQLKTAAAASRASEKMLKPRNDGGKGLRIHSIEYRNLAPLYAEEPLKLCGRKVEPGKYELWAETPEGGIAVRGTAKTDIPAS